MDNDDINAWLAKSETEQATRKFSEAFYGPEETWVAPPGGFPSYGVDENGDDIQI